MIHDLIYEMMQVNTGDPKRINHVLKMYGYAQCIAGRENVDAQTQQITLVAAVLHDIAIRYCEDTYGSCNGKLQEKHGPDIAAPILRKYTDDTALIDRVKYLIAHHHTYDNIDGIDYQIIIEADFIVNFDEDNFSASAFDKLYNKYFKTQTGKQIAAAMFGQRKSK